jgi:urease accessory protein UreF
VRRAHIILRVSKGAAMGAMALFFLAHDATPQHATAALGAMETCTKILPSAREYGAEDVIMGEQSTAGEVADWQENRHAPDITWVHTPIRSEPRPTIRACRSGARSPRRTTS